MEDYYWVGRNSCKCVHAYVFVYICTGHFMHMHTDMNRCLHTHEQMAQALYFDEGVCRIQVHTSTHALIHTLLHTCGQMVQAVYYDEATFRRQEYAG
jgi:hypothetical protein